MPSHEDNFPWEYLRHASVRSLESFELARLSHAANLRKEIVALVDQWLEESATALLARWLLEHWTQLHGAADLLPDSLQLESQAPRKAPAALGAAHRGRGGATA